jgi:hypothetical protein
MTVEIFSNIEEALSREVRRISFVKNSTVDKIILKDTFDPFSGELVSIPLEPSFYANSADTNYIQYPHFFIKLLKIKEDLTTGRVITQYDKSQINSVVTSPKAYEILLMSSEGTIPTVGNNLTTGIFQIRKAQTGHLLRILSGNNIGTYKITTVTPSISGNHTITVSNDLVLNLPALSFNSTSRVITFLDFLDISTVKVGDKFVDSLAVDWVISAIDAPNMKITITGVGSPSLLVNGKLSRIGNVFQTVDAGLISYTVMDPTKPVMSRSMSTCQSYTSVEAYDPQVPIDAYYLIRIESKERKTHIDIATRMWEEFNPPRTALPTIVRTKLSAEQLLTLDVTTGGSNTVTIKDNSNFNINDPVFIFDDFHPTKAVNGIGFEEVLAAKVIQKIGTTQLVFDITIPDTFKVNNHTKIVSHASYHHYMFHFVDHITKDIEGAQYWSHEFTFWVQTWIDRQGEPTNYDAVIQDIGLIGFTTNDIEILP